MLGQHSTTSCGSSRNGTLSAFNIDNGTDMKLAQFPIFDGPATEKRVKERFDSLADRHIPTDAITELQTAQLLQCWV